MAHARWITCRYLRRLWTQGNSGIDGIRHQGKPHEAVHDGRLERCLTTRPGWRRRLNMHGELGVTQRARTWPFVVGNPQAENLAFALAFDAQGYVNGLCF